jgi:hypothetical protein
MAPVSVSLQPPVWGGATRSNLISTQMEPPTGLGAVLFHLERRYGRATGNGRITSSRIDEDGGSCPAAQSNADRGMRSFHQSGNGTKRLLDAALRVWELRNGLTPESTVWRMDPVAD